MPKLKLATGVVGWSASERRSDRYGAITITDSPFDSGPVCVPSFSLADINTLMGKRVRLTLVADEVRKSGHIGDLFHKIKPSTPEIGEVIDLGVGILGFEETSYGDPSFVLCPGDGREALWIDPRKLYRAHDQTVSVFAEETTEDFSPSPDLKPVEDEEVVSDGDDGVQVKCLNENTPVRLHPNVTPLGDGMFAFDNNFKQGDTIRHTRIPEEEVTCPAAATAPQPRNRGRKPRKA